MAHRIRYHECVCSVLGIARKTVVHEVKELPWRPSRIRDVAGRSFLVRASEPGHPRHDWVRICPGQQAAPTRNFPSRARSASNEDNPHLGYLAVFRKLRLYGIDAITAESRDRDSSTLIA